MDDSGELKLCERCRAVRQVWEMVPMERVRASFPDGILEQHPELAGVSAICASCLAELRIEQMRKTLEEENAALHEERRAIYDGFDALDLMKRDINAEIDQQRTVSERISDKVTGFVGSWSFIIAQVIFLTIWIIINSLWIIWIEFDPYPYIFLNLVLSWAAALQVPLIMMSQNRQNDRDRQRSQHDYQVNLMSELEVRHLHKKIDELLTEHWQRLVEIEQQELALEKQQVTLEQMQIDMMRKREEKPGDGEEAA